MNLFYYKHHKYSPLLFLIVKLTNLDDMTLLEQFTHELFQILIDHGGATNENILIFSIIKDYEKSTQNLILPSIKSNNDLVDKCNNTDFINNLIVEILKNSDSEFYIELLDNKIIIHDSKINLMAFTKFYSL